jgi:hypothetical protein
MRMEEEMSRIGDELREWIDDENLYPAQIAELRRIAGRIDKEMVGLPLGADGRPIHVGDTVYADNDFSLEYKVSYIGFSDKGVAVGIKATGIDTYRGPACITHERPDSWARIADELEAKTNGCGHQGFVIVSRDEIDEMAARIRALAGKGDGR